MSPVLEKYDIYNECGNENKLMFLIWDMCSLSHLRSLACELASWPVCVSSGVFSSQLVLII